MTANANPSRDPANDDSLLGMANELLKKHLQSVDDMLPARVVSYNRAKNRAQVQPLIRVLTTDNRQVTRAQIASVPVMQFGGGGHVLSFNLKPGDLGWIKANDRDISLFLQSYAENAPNTMRLHKFQDAVFIPDVMTGYAIAGEDDENAVFQTLDGTVKVSLSASTMKLAAPGCTITMAAGVITVTGDTQVILTAPLVSVVAPDIDLQGNVTQSGGDATMAGNINLTGDIIQTGNIALTGSLNASVQVTANTIPLTTHKHTGIVVGGGTSGGPVP